MSYSIQPIFLLLQEHSAENASLWEQIVHSNILNIAIAFIFLVWVFKRFKLLGLIDQRQASIVKDLKDAEAKREKALADLQEIERKTARLTEEVSSILKDAEKTAEMVAQAIVKSAEEDAEKIIANAKKRIELEQKTAARDLETRMMREAIHGARQLLENTLSEDDKHRSVEEFINTLPELYQQGASR